MDEMKCVLGMLLLCLFFHVVKGQVAPSEMLQNKTFCDLTNVNITCDSNEMIAVESLNFYYHPDCNNTCCRFHNNHSSVAADDNDMQDVRRECSGRQSCSVDKAGPRSFEIVGNKTPSYAVLHYACIPENRTTAICNSKELKSDGLPLYLTNVNYPSVTTGSDTCSCSIEVNTCTSNVTLSILDVDLYLDHTTCDQNIELRDGMGELLERLDCGVYNNSFPARELKSHYVKIDFINNSTQNQEGLFFIGFAASEEIASFSLSCPAKKQTVCLQCEDTIDIPHGGIMPHDVTNRSEGALANVSCDVGYEPDNLTITCLGNGKWENATCRPKDCGNVTVIENGKYELEDDTNTTFGAVAFVTCNKGYKPDKNNITCLQTGQWSNSSCTAINCKSDYQIDNGKVSSAETTVGSVAVVTCNTGYTASSPIVECLSTGEWQDATCTIKDCEKVYELKNGTITLTSSATTYGATATVACDEGFNASIPSIKCLGTGKWEDATCNIADCGKLPKIQYGSVILKEEHVSTFGSTAEVKCQDGYRPKKQIIQCEETGVWESGICESHPGDGSNTGTIVIALVITAVVLINIILVGCILYRKYRRQGYLFHAIGKGSETVSFKNKEDLPDDEGRQNQTLEFTNETDKKQELTKSNSKESLKKEENSPEVKTSEDSNIPVKEDEKSGNSTVDAKTEEKKPDQEANESAEVSKSVDEEKSNNVQKSNETTAIVETSDPLQAKNESSETSKPGKNDDLKDNKNGDGSNETKDSDPKESQTSPEKSEESKNVEPKEDAKAEEPHGKDEVVKNEEEKDGKKDPESMVSATGEVSKTNPSEGNTNQVSSETSEVSKNDPEVNVKEQGASVTNEVDKNDNAKGDGDKMSEPSSAVSEKKDAKDGE